MNKFCYLKHIIAPKMTLRAASSKGKYWLNGDTIEYYLDGGSNVQHEAIRSVLQEVMSFTGLKFQQSDRSSSDIRIGFVEGGGSWSYVGTDAMLVPIDENTMNIGWHDSSLGVYRHEISHAIAMAHEHQSPSKGINWDKEAVYEDLGGSPNFWDKATIDYNVLDLEDRDSTNFTEFDPKSVMLYEFPAKWTLDGEGTQGNSTFSETDIAHLSQLYPKTATEPLDILKIIISSPGDSETRMHKSVWVNIAKHYNLDSTGSKKQIYARVKRYLSL